MPKRESTTRGFKRTAQLVQGRVRRASESRGFAQSRLLTHWPEIVGDDIAAIARPVNISYGRQGLGAVLTVLTTGAQAPMTENYSAARRTAASRCGSRGTPRALGSRPSGQERCR